MTDETPPQSPPNRRYLTAEDIAAELGIPLSTASARMREMRPVRIGKLLRVPRVNFENWLRLQRGT